jgi:hypothetical protein
MGARLDEGDWPQALDKDGEKQAPLRLTVERTAPSLAPL